MRIFFVVLCCVFSNLASAKARDWEGLYQGTIGTAKILVLLSHADGLGEDSRYSYAGKPYDLGLTLEKEGEELRFVESRKLGAESDDLKGRGKALISGRWTLRQAGENLSGTWQDAASQKTLPIVLALVSKPQNDKQKSAIGLTYHLQWVRDVRFSVSRDHKAFGTIRTGMVRDSVFNLAFPRLLAHPDGERMSKVNALLEVEHRLAVAYARQCQEYRPRQRPDEIKVGNAPDAENVFVVTYATPTLLSMTESGSIYCGGAHPNNYTRSMNYDLTTAERLFDDEAELEALSAKNLGRIFHIDTQARRENFNRFWWDRWMAGATKVAAKSKNGDDYTDCEGGFMNERPMAERTADFHFTPKGLAVTRTDYAHAMSVCLGQDYNPLVIPWRDLKPWLNPGQRLLGAELR
jgi:hypothetical protein